ncbi:MAG: hypothetical protein K2X47_01215, partial [Bdellovibrionales bacterium]|nr:hypothetical protein [Bdellovibrionales bacterium]
MLHTFLLITVGFLGLEAHSQSQISCRLEDSSSLSAAKIQKLIDSPCSLPLEQIIALLPKSLRKNSTFVYESAALYSGCIDEKHPRVIFFSDDAQFIFTFPWRGITEPLGACATIETMEWNQTAGKNIPSILALSPASQKIVGATYLSSPKSCV